jgi:WD40 repeat protein/uncharacterized caspase-like protein
VTAIIGALKTCLYAGFFALGFLAALVPKPGQAQVTIPQAPSAPRLASVPGPELRTQLGHSQVVDAVSFSPGDRFVVTCSQDGSALLWEQKSGREIRRFVGTSNWVRPSCNSVAFSSDGRYIVTGNVDRVARLWDIQTGNNLRSFEGHSSFVLSVALAPNGKTLVTGSADKTARLWDVSTGRELRKFEKHTDEVSSVAYSPDGRYILTASFDGTARLWDAITGVEYRLFEGHAGRIYCVAFSRDGKSILTAGEDSTVRVWDVSSSREIRRLTGHTKQVESVAVSPDGTLIASGAMDSTVRFWDLATGREIRRYVRRSGDSSYAIWSVAFSHDGKYVLIGCNDAKAALLAVANANETRSFESSVEPVSSVAFSPDGTTILTAGFDQTARVWSLKTGQMLEKLQGHTRPIPSASFSSDGRFILTSSWDGTARIWDGASGVEIRRFDARLGSFFTSAAFSPNGLLVVTGSARLNNNSAELWDVATGKQIRQLMHAWPVSAVAFSPDGHWIVTAGANTAILWDANTGTDVRRFAPSETQIAALAFSPDGKFVIVGDLNRSARLIRVSDGAIVHELRGATGAMQHLAFSNDGASIISGGMDGAAETWNVITGAKIRRFIGHGNYVASVALSPDNRLALTGSGDGTVRIWNAENGDQLSTISPFRNGDWAIATQDGRIDTNKLDGIAPLHWIIGDQPLTPLPLEIFMRDYYEPRLLPRLLACHEAEASGTDPEACAKAFKPVRPLASLNRIQPKVRISKVERGGSADEALVTVEVSGRKDATQKNRKTETAAYDLRLFRNSQIVGQWPEPKGGMGGAEDIGQWQSDSLVRGTEHEGKARHTFKVRLADRDKGQPVQFTAYAFNEDRVKSETASPDKPYLVPDDVDPAKPRAYVIAIGVNAYDNPEWKLGFAVKDALDLSGTLKSIERYEVVSVPLVSGAKDETKLDEATKQKEPKQATKQNIADVLALLGGHEEARERLRQALRQDGSVVDRLRKATPDDLVIVGFSGHGYADRQSRFYLLPSNSGTEAPSDEDSPKAAEILSRFISSEELSHWLKDVDAGELAMIIDACHSAASVDQPGFKPGPMGDRGLGQLAYDKGMRILAATQADNVALESEKLGQGLLTYALVDEGLEARKAASDGKGPITIGAWLHYAEHRVPQLYDDLQAGRIQAVKIVVANDASRSITKEPIVDPAFRDQIAKHAQTPQLFDFYKLQYDPVL